MAVFGDQENDLKAGGYVYVPDDPGLGVSYGGTTLKTVPSRISNLFATS